MARSTSPVIEQPSLADSSPGRDGVEGQRVWAELVDDRDGCVEDRFAC
jgi:hypothetical protein